MISKILRCAQRFLGASAAVLFLAGTLQAQATIHTITTTDTKPDLSSGCPTVSTAKTFASTATRAYLYFFIDGLQTNDVVTDIWLDPQGSPVYPPSGPWAPVQSSGSWCYTDGMDIAGQPAGNWTIQIFVNQTLLTTFQFSILTSGSPDQQYQIPLPAGYYDIEVTLAPGERSGSWGLEVLSNGPSIVGGFNLGGGFDAAGSQHIGFAGFNLSTAQTVSVNLNAQALPGASGPSVSVAIVNNSGTTISQTFRGSPPIVFNQSLSPGFYVVRMSSLAGQGTYQLALGASSFSGGVDVGGFIAGGLTGFGALNLPTNQTISLNLYSLAYGSVGAGKLNVRVLNQNRQVVWSPTSFLWVVARNGTGSGTVASNPSGINCGTVCNFNFYLGQPITLTATPASGSVFSGWANCPSPNGTVCTATVADTRTVTATFSVAGNLLPVANFGWSPASPLINQPVLFTDLSAGSPTSRSWNFGDGTTSTLQNPTHTYANAGPYSVSLTVTNSAGSNTVVKSVTVSSGGNGGSAANGSGQ